ncbi:homoserine dehydrogenase, partial [Aerococcus sp. UMB8608]|nr:homoserine dehydrogenase [Aerococcus sp. UMB8608]
GISQIKQADIQVAKQLGYTIKLLGSTSCQDGQIYAEVAPTLVPNSHPLATVNAEMNAVYTVGQASGELMFYGAGAG